MASCNHHWDGTDICIHCLRTKTDAMKYNQSLAAVVHAALDTAVNENGYRELLTWPVDKITADLRDCCADSIIERTNDWLLRLCVEVWLKQQGVR